jgi:hypothetical protein
MEHLTCDTAMADFTSSDYLLIIWNFLLFTVLYLKVKKDEDFLIADQYIHMSDSLENGKFMINQKNLITQYVFAGRIWFSTGLTEKEARHVHVMKIISMCYRNPTQKEGTVKC